MITQCDAVMIHDKIGTRPVKALRVATIIPEIAEKGSFNSSFIFSF